MNGETLTYEEVYRNLSSITAMSVAISQSLRKKKGERDTEFVKRIVAAYVTDAQQKEGTDGVGKDVPHYLGTDPAIATEDMQRLVRESGCLWDKNTDSDGKSWFCVWGLGTELYESGASLIESWARAVVAKGKQK